MYVHVFLLLCYDINILRIIHLSPMKLVFVICMQNLDNILNNNFGVQLIFSLLF